MIGESKGIGSEEVSAARTDAAAQQIKAFISDSERLLARNPLVFLAGIGAIGILMGARGRPRNLVASPTKPPVRSVERNVKTSTGRGSNVAASATQQTARPAGAERGRQAEKPSEIPAKGWKDILWRIYENVPEHRVVAIAAGVTFFGLLAIFPGVAALVALYGLFADPATISKHLADIGGVLPGGATDVIGDQLNRLTSQAGGTLGFAFVFGLLTSLWSTNAGMKALFDALNIVYGEKEKRGFFKLNAVSLAFTVGALVIVLLAFGAIAVLPAVMDYFGIATVTEWLVTFVKWPVLLLVVAAGIALIYRDGPSREEPKWRWVTGGSAFAALSWLAMSLLFSWYASHFGSFNKTYGSLGAVIGFMMWMWLSTIVILLGAELDAEMEHQTARDTTKGPAKPLGSRGARVADTVGKPSD